MIIVCHGLGVCDGSQPAGTRVAPMHRQHCGAIGGCCGLDSPRAFSAPVIPLVPLLQSLLPKCLCVITSVLQKGKARKQQPEVRHGAIQCLTQGAGQGALGIRDTCRAFR